MVTRYKEDFHIFLVDQGIDLFWYVEKLMFISTNDLCTYVRMYVQYFFVGYLNCMKYLEHN